MPLPAKPSSELPSRDQQRRQANVMLLRLQWLLLLLLVIAMVWSYIRQQRFEQHMTERLQSNEHVLSRLNEMDDRLYAVSQQALPEPNRIASSQAQNQLELLRMQIQAADGLLSQGNNKAATDLLQGLHWQMSQPSNEIAPALTVAITQSLLEDIERLQAQRAQPSPWQLQTVAIQNIQEFLYSLEHETSADHTNTAVSKRSDLKTAERMPLTRRQLVLHEVIMTLNLANQASNMRDQQQLVSYLRQARQQLNSLTASAPTPIGSSASSDAARTASTTTASTTSTMQVPTTLSEVIAWLDTLISDAPTHQPLLTAQILEHANTQD